MTISGAHWHKRQSGFYRYRKVEREGGAELEAAGEKTEVWATRRLAPATSEAQVPLLRVYRLCACVRVQPGCSSGAEADPQDKFFQGKD